jgi:hypothetical protein
MARAVLRAANYPELFAERNALAVAVDALEADKREAQEWYSEWRGAHSSAILAKAPKWMKDPSPAPPSEDRENEA